ncbi:glutamate--cysteine ligase [Cyanobacterium sp. uoEpiScrs1]|uniref:glutamate--cysteine ligase n=1 Tax=Cyanobacterium sp. uoEpiScrs1 TaxID=2976343 RepID=UPI002269E149|nr:glutamate--cysteine ligase [Cyanobacterium sp. uoEpiScrs1]
MRLSKGLEIEIYTGTSDGQIVGLSERIIKDLQGFVREPDSRNIEYTTAPLSYYDRLLCSIIRPRHNLRKYLQRIGNFTLIPGSTLSLGGSNQFYRSDLNNPYHNYIEKTYGTRVVTASVHINIGINDPDTLIRACRLARLEAPLYLALSASSPFLDGQLTGYHSTRWHLFPYTPDHVPLFINHSHFIHWTEEQLAHQTMQNVRHLWTSVRPNGDNRPYSLNRLELRICDLIIEPITLLSVVALLEARLIQVINDTSLDPLLYSQFSPDELLTITAHNEKAVAKHSLTAKLTHWQDGRKIDAQSWIQELYQETLPIAKQRGFSCFLNPIKRILQDGNLAQQWLRKYQSGCSITSILTQEIEAVAQLERELENKLCRSWLVA